MKLPSDCTSCVESCECTQCKLERVYMAIEDHIATGYYTRSPVDEVLWSRYRIIRYTEQENEG